MSFAVFGERLNHQNSFGSFNVTQGTRYAILVLYALVSQWEYNDGLIFVISQRVARKNLDQKIGDTVNFFNARTLYSNQQACTRHIRQILWEVRQLTQLARKLSEKPVRDALSRLSITAILGCLYAAAGRVNYPEFVSQTNIRRCRKRRIFSYDLPLSNPRWRHLVGAIGYVDQVPTFRRFGC